MLQNDTSIKEKDIIETRNQFNELYSKYPELTIEEKDMLNNLATFLNCVDNERII